MSRRPLPPDRPTPERSSEPRPEREPEAGPPRTGWWLVAALASLAVLLLLWQDAVVGLSRRSIPYSEFKAYLERGEVAECVVGEHRIQGRIAPRPLRGAGGTGAQGEGEAVEAEAPGGAAEGEAKPPSGAEGFLFVTDRVEDPGLVDALARAEVRFEGERPNPFSRLLLIWVLPFGLLFLLWMWVLRRMAGPSPGASALSFGKSRARLVADREVGVSFADVAGCEEAKAELREVVDFLRHPERFARLGARIPHGILLVGPPGTGKTLLARAVAGEARVPFFQLSGSDFVEMFVGVGAARVRDLFEQAKKVAPCIVFIDELDAVGRQRGVHVVNVNDEREHTLNQLLVELDGFEPNSGVILLSATNRPDVLDPALLRPGRFDRQVVLDAPDVNGREAILRVHVRGKPLGEDVDVGALARSTPGFSGADLANAVNEAALLAARRGHERITQKDLEDAVEKVVAGPEQKSRRLGDAEKRRVAVHEAGHALVAAHTEGADPVRKISIVPRGRAALGYTLQLPAADRHLLTRGELLGRLRCILGGRAAEEVVLGEVSTGAEDDLDRATALARQFVGQFGMGESVGLMRCLQRGGTAPPFDARALQRDCSEETARAVDEEVRRILDEGYEKARRLLERERAALDRVVRALLQRETLDEEAFRRLLQADVSTGNRDTEAA